MTHHALSERLGSAFFFFFPHISALGDKVHCSHTVYALFTKLTTTLFRKNNIKNGSHSTIHTFKNYFTYFYVIKKSFDKTNFTCTWINLSRFMMIITSGYIEDMKITQELFKKSAICKSRYLLDRSLICWDSLKLDTYLDLSSLRDSNYSQHHFYSKRLFVYEFV